MGPDHLSRIESGEEPTILEDILPIVQLFTVTMIDDQNKEFNAIIHFLSTGYTHQGFSTNQKKHLVIIAAYFTLIVGHLYKLGTDEILHRCVFNYKRPWVMSEAHVGVTGGHYAGKATVRKIL